MIHFRMLRWMWVPILVVGIGALVVIHGGELAQGANLLGKPAVDGQMVLASVKAGGRQYLLEPNQVGYFPTMYVKPNERVNVKVSYPDAGAEDVVLQVQDGGELDGGERVTARSLAQKSCLFTFRAAQDPGSYRVTLQRGEDLKVLDFWVGPPLPVAKPRRK